MTNILNCPVFGGQVNLISSIVITYNSEVWSIIKTNVSYLAKILVLKQKFPEAYFKLKEKWYLPEEIHDVYKKAEENKLKEKFNKFMVNTSRISTKNAEPFLYFKKPVVYKNLKDSEDLHNNLIQANFNESNTIINQYNQSEIEKNFVPFISDIFGHYKNQKEILWNIFYTQLMIVFKNKLAIDSKRYYNESMALFDQYLWEYYTKIPSSIIFIFYINNKNLSNKIRENIIFRYISALNSEESKEDKNKKFFHNIIEYLVLNKHFLNDDNITKISAIIEKKYSEDSEIIRLFDTKDLQNLFISLQSLNNFISSIKLNEINKKIPLLFQMKEFIIEKEITEVLVKEISYLVEEDNTNPKYSEEKKTLMFYLYKIFKDIIIANKIFVIKPEMINDILNKLARSFDGINAWDKRYIALINIIKLKEIADESQISIIKQKTNSFFHDSSYEGFNDLFNFLNENESDEIIFELIKDNLILLKPRMNTDDDNELLKVIYEAGNKEIRIELLEHIINVRSKSGLEFIRSLDSIPDKNGVYKALLQKVETINPPDRVEIYNFINEKLKINSNSDLKELAKTQMINLLKTDDSRIAEIGFNFFIESNFIGRALKIEMLKEILDFLRAPGKNVTSENRYAILVLTMNFSILQRTTQEDYILFLFDLLNQKYNSNTIQVALEHIEKINPKYSDYQMDFDRLNERLKVWSEDDKRNLIISSITKYKTKRQGKVEKEFWSEIELMKKQPEDS